MTDLERAISACMPDVFGNRTAVRPPFSRRCPLLHACLYSDGTLRAWVHDKGWWIEIQREQVLATTGWLPVRPIQKEASHA